MDRETVCCTLHVFLVKMYMLHMDQIVLQMLSQLSDGLSAEAVSLALLLVCFTIMLAAWRQWGDNGLYLYSIVAIICANIQVLKTTPFFVTQEPMALGTVLFATTFTVSDILTEHSGVESARKGVVLGFAAQVMMTIFMMFTIAYPVEGDISGRDHGGDIINNVQFALFTLFCPSVRLLVASLSSYYISQIFDIKIYEFLKDYTDQKFMWLRFNISTVLSGFLDNVLFSVLAWVVLGPNEIDFHILVFTYILGTYAARVLVSICSTPVMYLSYLLKAR